MTGPSLDELGERICILGPSNAGKSTLAQAIGRQRQLPVVHLDQLYHLPNSDWVPRPTRDFWRLHDEAIAQERWVMDGNYSAARELIWPRATHIVWLNYSRPRVFAQVLQRTVRRGWSRAPLWAGNRESLRKAFLSRDSILLWSLTTFTKNRRRYADLRASGAYAQAQWVELRTPQQARAWVADLARRG